MADSVYYHLERMLPELDDLKERGLFSDAEVKEIAKRRREFEFRLERRSKMKEDYLNYIKYELQLEKLRLLRKKSLVREMQSSKQRWQPSLCDRASAMRIMLIYQRAVTRFKGDLDLWVQYLEYCKSQGTRRMQKVLTKVLRLHPTVPDVWIYASAWEFEQNKNIVAARALMQRGLRMCSQSEQLWLEYFRLELVYAERLKANIFSPVTKKNNAITDFDRDSAKEIDLILRIDDTNRDVPVPRGNKGGINELAYKLAYTIYQNAITALPSNAGLRRKFVELLQKAHFTQASSLQDEIFTSLEKDFLLNADCWDWQARFRFRMTGDMEIAIKVYEKALGVVSSADMYMLYALFLKESSGLEGQNVELTSVGLKQSKECRVLVAKRLQSIYDRAKEAGVLSSGLAGGHAKLLLQLGKLDLAKQLLEEFCMGQFRNCTRMWAMRIVLEIKSEVVAEFSLIRIADLFEQALKHISSAEAGELWALVLEYSGGQIIIYDLIVDIMLNKLASSEDQTSALLACSLIDWSFCNQDIKHTRSVYDRMLALPHISMLVYKHCINVECQMAAMGCKDAPKCVRRLFECALSKHPQNAKLWLDYCSLEMMAGNPDAAEKEISDIGNVVPYPAVDSDLK
ncbi:hypothetical protein GOP47_0012109 [Adiantum capillus-veneris]|uniref:U3 small nucleolar RNA-associated protein 6 n=1 Tax=Adiantum capillus-veneris TaxID=13818 RepID=A0A9D4URF3_ADICA|nr:hypothetical protein GOP47_0012109 [Adiantum capillus-veneris]